MFRILNFVSVIALLAAAGAVYHVKYSSAFEAQKIAKLRGEIRYERDRIATLNAEWARRTAPDRIQSQAEHHLDMQPLDVERMDKLASLPAKPDQSADPLSGMIEALVDGPNPAPQAAIPVKPTAAKPVAFRPRPAADKPLPLSAMPAAGSMVAPRPGFAGSQGSLGAPLNPTSGRPLLPPGSVGQ